MTKTQSLTGRVRKLVLTESSVRIQKVFLFICVILVFFIVVLTTLKLVYLHKVVKLNLFHLLIKTDNKRKRTADQ